MRQLDLSEKKAWRYSVAVGVGTAFSWSILFGSLAAQAEPSAIPGQVAPMRHNTIKMSPDPEVPRTTPPAMEAPSMGVNAQAPSQLPLTDGVAGSGYDPSGRRDPFAPIIQERLVTLDDCLAFGGFFFQETVRPAPEDLVGGKMSAVGHGGVPTPEMSTQLNAGPEGSSARVTVKVAP